MPCPIESDAVLLRAVRHDPSYIHADDNTGGWIPTKLAVAFQHDSESVFCDHLLEECGGTHVDVATYGGAPGYQRVVFTLIAGDATQLGFGVEHSPNSDTPIGAADGDVNKPEGLTKPLFRDVRQRLLLSMRPADPTQITLPRP